MRRFDFVSVRGVHVSVSAADEASARAAAMRELYGSPVVIRGLLSGKPCDVTCDPPRGLGLSLVG